MEDRAGLRVAKPVSEWNKLIGVGYKELFKGLAKTAGGIATGNPNFIIGGVVDSLFAFKTEYPPEALAWLLIQRSLYRACLSLIKENENLFSTKYKNIDAIDDASIEVLETENLTIDADFFKNPKQLSILPKFQEAWQKWLKDCGLSEADSKSIVDRFPSYFVFALNEEWRDKPNDYQRIQEAVNTPFTSASQEEQGWIYYHAQLQKQIDEPLFLEAFSLRQVYIPLRAYYEENKSSQENSDYEKDRRENNRTRIVVELEQELIQWFDKQDKNDALRIICGGLGFGKSSFCKIFAARQAEHSNNCRILFVPLHRFELKKDLIEAVGEFIRYEKGLSCNPLDPEKTDRLLIIFDGLDELAQQGKIGAETAKEFIKEVKYKINAFNQNRTRLQVIISGRDVIVQANNNEFNRQGQVLHILPYFIWKLDCKNYSYRDENNLLNEDRRQLWWQKYGKATGKEYERMPQELAKDNLTDITTVPLLNYLLSLSLNRGKIQFDGQILREQILSVVI
jgi:hypothetical protein